MRMVLLWLFNPAYKAERLFELVGNLRGDSFFNKVVKKIACRMLAREFGCHLSPLAQLGGGVHLPHPFGIVIGDGVRLGRNVTLYQHVTIGRRSINNDRYPKIGNSVIIYAGAVIAGDVTVGDCAVIGANCVVLSDVPPGALVVARTGKIVEMKPPDNIAISDFQDKSEVFNGCIKN